MRDEIEIASSSPMMARRRRVSELRRGGMPLAEIAAEVGVCRATVANDLRWITEQLRCEIVKDAELDKAVQLQRLEANRQMAIQSFEASKAPEVRATEKRKPPRHEGGPERIERATVTVERSGGDPRFLEEARKAVVEHLRFTVGYAPVKAMVKDQETEDAWRYVFENQCTDEELKVVQEVYRRVQLRLMGDDPIDVQIAYEGAAR
jgi:hypothetical protein